MNKFLDVQFKTGVGSLIFSPVAVYRDEGIFDFNISCVLAKKFSGLLSGDFACRLYRNDIERLISYFDSHVQGLMAGTLAESPAYMPLEGDIQIKGLDGDVVDFSDGCFSISVLFNCGRADESSSNSYFGFETIVELSELHEFCEGLKCFVKG